MSTHIIHNVETGEIIEKQLTAAELTQLQKSTADDAAMMAARAEAIAAKEAVLSKLGLTAEEAAALLS